MVLSDLPTGPQALPRDDDRLPRCCTALDSHWPLPVRLPGLHLVSTGFDPARLDPADFARLGMPEQRGVAKRQAEYQAGRACAFAALRRLTGQGAMPGRDDDRAPCWPTGVVGSITHGHGLAAAIVGAAHHWQGLGLDLEALPALERADRLAGEVLTPGEYRHYRQRPDAERRHLLGLTFSLKESLFKALFPQVRRRFHFQDAELLADTGPGPQRLRLRSDLSLDWPAGREVEGHHALFDGLLISLVAIPA